MAIEAQKHHKAASFRNDGKLFEGDLKAIRPMGNPPKRTFALDTEGVRTTTGNAAGHLSLVSDFGGTVRLRAVYWIIKSYFHL